MPLEALVLETDSPDMPLQGEQGTGIPGSAAENSGNIDDIAG